MSIDHSRLCEGREWVCEGERQPVHPVVEAGGGLAAIYDKGSLYEEP